MTTLEPALTVARRHRDAGRQYVAEPIYVRLMKNFPDDAQIACEAGDMALSRGNFKLAIDAYQRVLDIEPDRDDIRRDLARALYSDGRVEACLEILPVLADKNPDDSSLHAQMAQALVALGRFDEAVSWRRRSVPPGAEDMSFALLLIRMGRFGEAWPGFENRPGRSDPLANVPVWDGVTSGRVAVVAEGGLSETVLFSRFVAVAAERGITPVVLAQAALHPFLRLVSGISELVAPGGQVENVSFHVRIFSLPQILGVATAADLPSPPYVTASPERVEHWRRKLAKDGDGRPVIGVSWEDSTCTQHQLRPLLGVAEARFVALHPLKSLEEAGSGLERVFEGSLPPDELAALVAALDLVISTDAPAAHIAGAQGKATWLLADHENWCWGGDEFPSWYPAARKFQRSPSQKWTQIGTMMADALRKELAEGNLTHDQRDI